LAATTLLIQVNYCNQVTNIAAILPGHTANSHSLREGR